MRSTHNTARASDDKADLQDFGPTALKPTLPIACRQCWRSTLKLWSGWPTFPMVFVQGTLVGGANDLQALIDSDEFKKMLA